jgi:hypothetical protein
MSLDLTIHTSLSPIWRGFMPIFVNYRKRCTRLAGASDKVYQLLIQGRWFSPGTPASSTPKTGRHDIAEILLKVAFNTKNQIKSQFCGSKKTKGLNRLAKICYLLSTKGPKQDSKNRLLNVNQSA